MADQDREHSPDVSCPHCRAKFPLNKEGFVTTLLGHELTKKYAEKNGFSKPIMVEFAEGLGLTVPVVDYNHYLRRLDKKTMVKVIHVEENMTIEMKLSDFFTCVSNPGTNGTLTMQSLELSSTRMNEEVTPPEFVRSIDFIEQAWSLSGKMSLAPKVSRFLQISMAGSYVNFHIESGGSSIWHHVLKGNEVFYLIKGPVKSIVTKYKDWYPCTASVTSDTSMQSESSNSNNSSMEDDEESTQEDDEESTQEDDEESTQEDDEESTQEDDEESTQEDDEESTQEDDGLEYCRVEVTEGQTIFLPGGIIRATFYPEETIVIGGNYLNIFNATTHLRIYQMEKDQRSTFMFPKFEEVFWRFACKVCRDFIGGGGVFSFRKFWKKQLRTIHHELSGWAETGRHDDDEINLLKDLYFILDKAKVSPHDKGYFILDSQGYAPASI